MVDTHTFSMGRYYLTIMLLNTNPMVAIQSNTIVKVIVQESKTAIVNTEAVLRH